MRVRFLVSRNRGGGTVCSDTIHQRLLWQSETGVRVYCPRSTHPQYTMFALPDAIVLDERCRGRSRHLTTPSHLLDCHQKVRKSDLLIIELFIHMTTLVKIHRKG